MSVAVQIVELKPVVCRAVCKFAPQLAACQNLFTLVRRVVWGTCLSCVNSRGSHMKLLSSKRFLSRGMTATYFNCTDTVGNCVYLS